MRLPVSLSPQAKSDLSDLWEYIAERSPDAADRLMMRIEDEIEQLSLHPQIGHTRHDLVAGDTRFWPVGDYLVIYRIRKDVIEVGAIMRGSRDIPNLFEWT